MEQQKRAQDRPKMNYACEACRAAKIKCQSGPQSGICKRCYEFKRECVFRTGPRTRRPNGTARRAGAQATLPPPGPSKTFSIDFEMPVMDEPEDDFEALSRRHEAYLDDLDEDEEVEQQLRGDGAAMPPFGPNYFNFADMSSSAPRGGTTSSKSQRSKPLVNLGIKPQFNLDSASKLLSYFRDMLPYMPILVLPEDADVRSLARNSPFVLLAILAVTSCSTSLQGHSLYDEEFRKVFGLKFVAGGERSLELLQGILIYCSWYPFHLRPKDKQAFQYLRMAVDIVRDLELDREAELFQPGPGARCPSLENIRAHLACFYAISCFTSVWSKTSTLRYGPQLARSAEVLEQLSSLEQDHRLVWQVRQQYIFEELADVLRVYTRGPRDHQAEMQRDLMRANLEAQFRDFQARMPAKFANTSSILMNTLVTEALILVPPIINVSRRAINKRPDETISPTRLLHAAHKVRAFFTHLTTLPPHSLSGFGGADYMRIITATLMAYRLSFPLLSICPTYDVAQGQSILDFGETLRTLIDDLDTASTPPPPTPEDKNRVRRTDTLYAFRIVLRSVKAKFEEKKAAFDASVAAASAATAAAANEANENAEWAAQNFQSICPMLNGSLKGYLPLWTGESSLSTSSGSGSISSSSSAAAGDEGNAFSSLGVAGGFVGPPHTVPMGGMEEGEKSWMYNDLWDTMTMGWPDADLVGVGVGDNAAAGFVDGGFGETFGTGGF